MHNTESFNSKWNLLLRCLEPLYSHCTDYSLFIEKLQLLLKNQQNTLYGPISEQSTPWFLESREVGIMLYVDLFAGNLKNIEKHLPYLIEMGITYVHLMPVFTSPEKENDGGYAVSSYRSIEKKLGTIEDLRHLATVLHDNNIRLVLDFVFNHTSDEHMWAQKAKEGDSFYRDFYFLFSDKTEVDSWNKTVREIFPNVRKGSFSYVKEVNSWVWTTFNSYQWDLNYSNPNVFLAMCEEMLYLANLGVDVLRLDALAFVWKEKGTSCENLPKAHTLIQAFRQVASIASPWIIFKSEAIVHPDNVIQYIGKKECEISYNPLQMALFWEATATRNTSLLHASLKKRWKIPEGCAWVNYIRCHDDIGWTFSDEDGAELGIDSYNHRRFLNQFYTGEFEGSFAKGEPFQKNEETGDCRISGTLASLAGLEEARDMHSESVASQNTLLYLKAELYGEAALRRIILLYSILFALPGIPLIYAGDEIGMLNDYSYKVDEKKQFDSRWVHRSKTDWERITKIKAMQVKKEKLGIREEGNADNWLLHKQQQLFTSIKKLIMLRKKEPLFSSSEIYFTEPEHQSLFGFYHGPDIFVIGNFSDDSHEFHIPQNKKNSYSDIQASTPLFTDLISGMEYKADSKQMIKPWDCLWLKRNSNEKGTTNEQN